MESKQLKNNLQTKLLSLLLISSSLFGYLEWSGNNQMFLFKIEATIFQNLFKNPFSVIHPLIIIPIIGQVFLLINLFSKKIHKILFFSGLICLGLLFILLLLIGLISLNYKIAISTFPFIALSFISLNYLKKIK